LNSGFENWTGGFFSPGTHGEKCCGAALATPTFWGIPEQLMAMPTNQFTYKETDSAHIHSGSFAARLSTNSTTRDSAGDVSGAIAVLVPGTVYCAGIIGYGTLGLTGDLYQTNAYSRGLPYNDTPNVLNFYMMFDHLAPDTASYAYAFTRWNSVLMKEDTLAAANVDISDDNITMNQWILFADTIRYQMGGVPDTLHMIFFGGRNADSTKVGNSTWLDDITLRHAALPPDTASAKVPSGIAYLSSNAISVYPNPVSAMLYVSTDQHMAGAIFELYDMTGSRVMQQPVAGALSSYSVAALAGGVYAYHLLDQGSHIVTTGRVTIVR
jgi:hypothetical protein